MRKLMGVLMAVAFLAMLGTASADDMVPGAYGQVDQSLMSQRTSGPAFRTQMQIGAQDRIAASRVNIGSGAGRSLSNAGNGGGADFQWGSSQTDQSWKKAKTVEEAQVRGLVPEDCGGENTTAAYHSQMKQSRKGYLSEPVISNAQCGQYHKTLSGPGAEEGMVGNYLP